jgi:adenylate kinase
MNVILLGPPGAGKGTQAEGLSNYLEVPHVASGDLFRDHLNRKTPLGQSAQEYMDKGRLVPDEVTIAMIRERLGQSDCEPGAVLDGFPRTLEQAEGLTEMFSEFGRELDAVIYISVPDDVLVQRLSGRRICRGCQTPYHVDYKPPEVEGVCDQCGGKLYQRDDDSPDTVRSRLQVYHKQTEPLCDYYSERQKLYEIDGSGAIDTVKQAAAEMMKTIEKELA